MRPRGWHMVEKHVTVDGKPVSASLFDFGLYFFHNAKALLARGSAPYFYLPKMESHLEARLWNDVFIHAQDTLGIQRGTIKATVLIETILAAFEMDEFLYELREHSAGLNCGRWDYIFSCLKKFGRNPDFILADRGLVVRKGRQTHGATPWSGIDPIVVASQIVSGLQTIVSRRVDISSSPAVVTVGTFHSGTRNNIIPDDAKLTGTIRTFDPAVSEAVRDEMRQIATGVAQSQGAEATVSFSEGNPATINDPVLLEQMRPTLVRIYGDANVRVSPPLMLAEDFAFYQQQVPGLFFFVGVRPPDVPADAAIPNHSPKFFADENALKDAVRAMASLAADYLRQQQ